MVTVLAIITILNQLPHPSRMECNMLADFLVTEAVRESEHPPIHADADLKLIKKFRIRCNKKAHK